MKILAINGSPNREGSTALLLEVFAKECENLGAKVDSIFMEDYTIVSCQECYKCGANKECYRDDDFIQLKAKILDSDGIVIASPYYDGRVIDIIEALCDRLLLSSYVKKEFKNKCFVGISTSAVDNAMNVAKFCANLGYNAKKGGMIVSGVHYESVILEDGIKEIKTDFEIAINIKTLAGKLIYDIKNKEKSIFDNLIDFVFTGWINFILIRFKRRMNMHIKRVNAYVNDSVLIKKFKRIYNNNP